MDLHTWITARVDAAENTEPPHRRDCDTLPKIHSCCGEADCYCGHDDTFPCDCGVPEAVLRRCEADRRILARHNVDPARADDWQTATNCEGCSFSGYLDLPNTENINDCPELLDLAHAHGITEQELAGLDRPQPPEREPSSRRIGHWLTVPTQTSDVPAALRGPNWTPRA
jgi:hypothetical protein